MLEDNVVLSCGFHKTSWAGGLLLGLSVLKVKCVECLRSERSELLCSYNYWCVWGGRGWGGGRGVKALRHQTTQSKYFLRHHRKYNIILYLFLDYGGLSPRVEDNMTMIIYH